MANLKNDFECIGCDWPKNPRWEWFSSSRRHCAIETDAPQAGDYLRRLLPHAVARHISIESKFGRLNGTRDDVRNNAMGLLAGSTGLLLATDGHIYRSDGRNAELLIHMGVKAVDQSCRFTRKTKGLRQETYQGKAETCGEPDTGDWRNLCSSPPDPELENAAPTGIGSGADLKKATKLSPTPYSESPPRTTLFWDSRSNSIETLQMRLEVPA